MTWFAILLHAKRKLNRPPPGWLWGGACAVLTVVLIWRSLPVARPNGSRRIENTRSLAGPIQERTLTFPAKPITQLVSTPDEQVQPVAAGETLEEALARQQPESFAKTEQTQPAPVIDIQTSLPTIEGGQADSRMNAQSPFAGPPPIVPQPGSVSHTAHPLAQDLLIPPRPTATGVASSRPRARLQRVHSPGTVSAGGTQGALFAEPAFTQTAPAREISAEVAMQAHTPVKRLARAPGALFDRPAISSVAMDTAKAKADDEKRESDNESGAAAGKGGTKVTPKTYKDFAYEDLTLLPHVGQQAHQATPDTYSPSAFSCGPIYPEGYDSAEAIQVYAGKHLNQTQRPWVELFRPLYDAGPIPPSSTWLGETNPVNPRWLVYGDWRSAAAFVDNGDQSLGVLATRLNLDIDLQMTSTERVHAFWGPLDRGQNFTRFQFGDGQFRFFDELEGDFDNLFFEGDLGAIVGGATGQYAPFTLPFAAGYMPLVFQNGIWLDDNILGVAATIPARNLPALHWANFDWTFFAGFDELNSPAFGADDSAVDVYGSTLFIEAYQGYIELGYAYLNSQTPRNLGYHNLGLSWTARCRDWFSYSTRYLVNVGQNPTSGEQTADGHLFLLETSLITAKPYTVVPYANAFLGLDRPQSIARNGNAGNILRNVGINFESDFLTGYPTLDASGNQVAGGAAGINLLGDSINHQWVFEAAMLHVLNDSQSTQARGNQYGLGTRYQKPLNHAWLIRADAMYGLFESASDVAGARLELRHKF